MQLFMFDSNETFKGLLSNLVLDLAKISDDNFANDDLSELINEFISKYHRDKIEIYIDDVNYVFTPKQVKMNIGNYVCDGYRFCFKIPFCGNVSLMRLRPGEYNKNIDYVLEQIIEPTDSKCGYILFCMEYTKDDVTKIDKVGILERFKMKFKPYLECFNTINNNIEVYNNEVIKKVNNILENRKQKVENDILLSKRLGIPLILNPNAPNITPVNLQLIVKPKPKMPKDKCSMNESKISDEDYSNIKKIINLACHSMEKTAISFNQFGEDVLRDIILANLNSHYIEMPTGETFSRIGKTDIRIQFDNMAAYIAECKLWGGEKILKDALNQLIGYTTWRDSNTSLILFNKKVHDFNVVTEAIENFVTTHETCKSYVRNSKNEWQCVFKKSIDTTEIINVNIVVFDLFVEKSDS